MSAAEIEAKKLEHKLARFNKDKAAARKVVQTMLEKVSREGLINACFGTRSGCGGGD